jgi:cytidylate kinase
MDLEDAHSLATMAAGLEISFDEGRITVDGADLTDVIRTEPVSAASSKVSAHEPVRAAILDLQRSMRRPPGLVADGRDMGTVVFKDAPLKIYLDASAEIRAERRYNQLKNKGLDVKFRALLANLEERDARDKARAVSPLVPAEDALIIDSTNLSIEEVLEKVLSEVEARQLTRQ